MWAVVQERERDKTQHKCAAEKRGQCVNRTVPAVRGRRKWFWSRGGLAVHRCRREEPEDDNSGTSEASHSRVEWRAKSALYRTFNWPGDLKRHERGKPGVCVCACVCDYKHKHQTMKVRVYAMSATQCWLIGPAQYSTVTTYIHYCIACMCTEWDVSWV